MRPVWSVVPWSGQLRRSLVRRRVISAVRVRRPDLTRASPPFASRPAHFGYAPALSARRQVRRRSAVPPPLSHVLAARYKRSACYRQCRYRVIGAGLPGASTRCVRPRKHIGPSQPKRRAAKRTHARLKNSGHVPEAGRAGIRYGGPGRPGLEGQTPALTRRRRRAPVLAWSGERRCA